MTPFGLGNDLKRDLVVMGAGLAGLTAAVRARQLGLSVLVLDQGQGDRYLCNSRYSGGILHLAFQDIADDPASLQAAMSDATNGFIVPELAELLARQALRSVHWLRDQGVRFIRNPQVSWQHWVLAPPRAITGGLDWEGRGPDLALRTLLARLRDLGGEIQLDTRVEAALVRDGRCVGLRAVQSGRAVEFEAGAVLIADGGFQANLDLMKAHIAPQPSGVLQRGSGMSRGDGLRLAQEMGAATVGMEAFYGHLLVQEAFANPKLWPYPQVDEIACAGVVVDRNGARVADEGLGGVYLANQIAHRPDPLDCHVIFDATIWDVQGRQSRIPANPHLLRGGATLIEAPTLAALAERIGVSTQGLERTVADHNQAVAHASCAQLDPPRTVRKHAPSQIARAPFHAFPICAGITHTAGGLKIDALTRVLDQGGKPIAGLHAAGAAAGGIEGGPQAGYVGGLMKALVLGVVAAERVAEQIKIGDK
jgi:fumarate reductase flavoprotein subunit